MPLAELQTALGMMIAVQAAGQGAEEAQEKLALLALTAREWKWLDSLPQTRGFKATCDIQQWWRETRLREMTRLTLRALGPAEARLMLAAYLRAHLCTSLFFLPEALAFLRFVASTSQLPHVAAIAQFEHALLQVREATADQAAEETIIEFAAPPEILLDALLQGHPLPEAGAECYPVIVSPSLPHLWQPASSDSGIAVRASVNNAVWGA
jgi:hypothetical protein